MRFALTLLLLCAVERTLSAEVGVFVGKEKASEFLSRDRRSNGGRFEEFMQGNFERECVEEQCNYEEAREVYENDADTATAWSSLWEQCTVPTNPCSHPGTDNCENKYNSYVCHCNPGYTGDICQSDINECDVGPTICSNSSTCVNTEGSYSCECEYGWTGDNCDTDVNECDQDICVNGVCINEPGTFACLCQSGYTGDTCVDDVDECALWSSLCKNGGSCVNIVGAYECQCPSGWTGSECTQDVNECETNNTCVHGECHNDFGTFSCVCETGYTGQLCDTDFDECSLGYCPEGATCIDGLNQFSCICPSAGCPEPAQGEQEIEQQQENADP